MAQLPIPTKTYSSLEDLVVAGSDGNSTLPLFEKLVPVGRPNLGNRAEFQAYLDRVWDTRYLTNDGPLLLEFQRQLANFAGVKHCIAMCNATLAIELLVSTLPIKPGVSEIIVPSFTFVATVHGIQRQGAVPVFADIDPVTYCMDPSKAEALINENTVGIMPVHLYGNVCDVDGFEALSKKYHLPVFYDAAHAFACRYKGRPVGQFGTAEIYSFHATKFFHSIEGGAVLTNDDNVARAVRQARNFGFAGYDNVICWGTNAKMNEVCAGMGLTNLRHVPFVLERNYLNFLSYARHINNIPGLELIRLATEQFSDIPADSLATPASPLNQQILAYRSAVTDKISNDPRALCACVNCDCEQAKSPSDNRLCRQELERTTWSEVAATSSEQKECGSASEEKAGSVEHILREFRLPANPVGVASNFQYILIRVRPEYGVSRDTVAKLLTAENVHARRYFFPGVHRMEPYRTLFPEADSTLPLTNEAATQVMVLPSGELIGDEHIAKICELLRFIHERRDEINARNL
eukprot:TRINITY_DN5661_c0_g1_i1.p1 TRINITY_DN5661_c0_g1~~TRINITY_DN5661_c0_g1_i1.p1  ORF type:complete len:539 (+),score=207.88 TRINITY_DN5661_c0_g1_i1:56-1618(+)